MRLLLDRMTTPLIDDLNFEVVERKGIGHPDTLADAIAERISRYYCEYFLSAYGLVAHHWFDKVMLIGGESELEYGHGCLLKPFTVVVAGKCVLRVGDAVVPIHEICTRAAGDVLSETLYSFDRERHLVIEVRVSDSRGPGQRASRYQPESAASLVPLPLSGLTANDCSICAGFAPASRLETLVLSADAYLTSPEFSTDVPGLGKDIKILGTRDRENFALCVNAPALSAFVASRGDYLEWVNNVERHIAAHLADGKPDAITITVNPEKSRGRSYLTVTGTVADTGDVGCVGRGNRVNGLITPMRPMSIEAAAGKNPLDHGGKVYSAVAMDLARLVAEAVHDSAEVIVTTSKERPMTDPDCVVIRTACDVNGRLRTALAAMVATRMLRVEEEVYTFLEGRVLW